jgi:hypothetical protein
MRCRTCEYPLWNLPARQCPECGSPFKPSDFDFTRQKVRFCCPLCDQQYFGTDERGHLVPPAFTCVACAAPIAMDDMIVRPLEGVRDEDAARRLVPWIERRKHGLFAAWFKTIRMAMTSPVVLIRALPVEGQSRRALWFALLTNFVFSFIALSAITLVMLLVGAATGAGSAAFAGTAAFLGVVTLVPLLAFIVALFLWALTAHAMLRLTGRTARGPRRTFDALCYATGANILAAIPCLGVYALAVSWIWSAVSATLMLRETHRVSGLRAAVAVFAFPLVVCVGLVSLVSLVFVPAYSRAATSAATSIARSHHASTIARALLDYAADHNGQPPAHAVELLATGRLRRNIFVHPGAVTAAHTIVNHIEVPMVLSLSPEDRRDAVAAVIATLPPNTVAHRVGHVVFTYHGLTLPPAATPAPDLWLAVVLPVTPGDFITVALVSGGTRAFPDTTLATELVSQNSLRAANSLPPLPDPPAITADQPAAGPP